MRCTVIYNHAEKLESTLIKREWARCKTMKKCENSLHSISGCATSWKKEVGSPHFSENRIKWPDFWGQNTLIVFIYDYLGDFEIFPCTCLSFFFTDTNDSQDSSGKEGAFIIPLYYFHPLTNIQFFLVLHQNLVQFIY